MPKAIKNNGLKPEEIAVSESAIRDILRYYTREAGVRGLERELSKICRKVVKSLLLKGRENKVTVNARNLDKYLGVRRYSYGIAEKSQSGRTGHRFGVDRSRRRIADHRDGGVAGQRQDHNHRQAGRGDAGIHSGGIERGAQPCANAWASTGNFYEKSDLHIHLPEGATPKDGPSAGIGICTAMVSALTGIPVRADVAMTGEITLRGEVLPIGGLKEKLLAAQRGGIKVVLIPEENTKDLVEIPDNVKNKLDIHPVKWIEQVLEMALERKPEPLPEMEIAAVTSQAVINETGTSPAIKH